MGPSAYVSSLGPSLAVMKRAAYSVIRGAVGKLLADELIHPVLLLIVGAG